MPKYEVLLRRRAEKQLDRVPFELRFGYDCDPLAALQNICSSPPH